MTMNRRKFFGTVCGVAAAVTLPSVAVATPVPQAAIVAPPPPPAPPAPQLGAFVSAMNDAYTHAIREVAHKPNDEITRRKIVSRLADVASTFGNQRAITNYQILCDDRNNSPSVVREGGNRVTVLYVLAGHMYPRELNLALKQGAGGLMYTSFSDRGIDGVVTYGNTHGLS